MKPAEDNSILSMMHSTPPNVLLITTDQQRFDHIGLAGTPGLKTPNLDGLGRDGVWFRRAYCPSPICTPTRVSLMVGRYPSMHGATSIGVTADPFPGPTLPELLKSVGYQSCLVGKTHFVVREDERDHIRGLAGAKDSDFRGWSGPYLGFDRIRASTGHTINCIPGMHYREFLEESGEDYTRWFPQMSPDYDHHVSGPWDIPDHLHDTYWVARESIQWIRERTTEPWFLWASFEDPHEPFVCPEPWFSQVDPDELRLYPGPPAHGFCDRPSFYGDVLERQEAGWGEIDDRWGVPCIFHWPRMDAQARTALRATCGMINFLDNRIGAILDSLRESGQIENTLIIFTSDHGDMHGHHGFWGKGLTAFEDCQRVPLLVCGAGVAPTGSNDAIVNLVDLPRTILSLAGVSIPQHMQGTDLSPLLQGNAEAVQRGTFIECQATASIFQLTYVNATHKVVVYRDSEEGELYELARDPDQQINLWNSPAASCLKEALLHEMIRERLRQAGHSHGRKAFA